MSRYLAATYHLGISIVVFTVLGYLVLYHWYPDYFFTIDGGFEGTRIIMAVDLVLGPLLTLIVFRSGKPGLKMDLSLIGGLQSICLLIGVYLVYSERPLYFVFYDGSFYSASADSYRDYNVRIPHLPEFDTRGPAFVQVNLPENPIEEAGVRQVLYQDGIPLWAYDELYGSLNMERVIARALTREDVASRDRQNNLGVWLEKFGGQFDDYAFIPIHSRYRQALLGIRRQSGEVLDILDVTPPLKLGPDR